MNKFQNNSEQNHIEDELSEKYIREHCPHCNLNSEAYKYLLEKTDNFSIVCDPHPITAGHILIIPKHHLSCIGEYPEDIYTEFLILYQKVSDFLSKKYGSISSFEHGKFGQTVFHSHVHFIPFKGASIEIVPEREAKLTRIGDLFELKGLFEKNGGYLFFSIENNKWVVDTNLTAPRFFRDRFAVALNRPERGNWKEMHVKEDGHSKPEIEAQNTKNRWQQNVN
ncbi:MAG: HIT domain-containing protein [Candidatus Daviesbacteria bacterium]|nr:HIT domain-containing protein [Candidatus Daviesbacteria bacterium]